MASAGPLQYGEVCMRQRTLVALTLLGGACIPYEPYWLVTEATYVGIRLTVVEPGGYSSLLRVPPGQRRTTALPLDTVELEWLVATPPDVTLEPPIWILCDFACQTIFGAGPDPGPLADCPFPTPIALWEPCRLGEGHRLRLGLDGAHSLNNSPSILSSVLVVGSRSPDVSPATCLERLTAKTPADLQPCLIGLRDFPFGPYWAALPFSPEYDAVPPELLIEDADTHPDITGFRVIRGFGPNIVDELLAAPGDTVTVRPHERISVIPVLVDRARQDYSTVDYSEGAEPIVTSATEAISIDAWMTALVDDFEEPGYFNMLAEEVRWTVPDQLEPATLYVSVRDSRAGRALAILRFVAESP